MMFQVRESISSGFLAGVLGICVTFSSLAQDTRDVQADPFSQGEKEREVKEVKRKLKILQLSD